MRAQLCAIVLSYRNEDTVLGAVDSLLEQDVPIEVVVSHSGGGPTPAMLRRLRPGVRVVSSEERRLPGAARNAGIRATRAPYVSFLAADCRALPGWARGRLRHHLAGADAVASSLVPAADDRISLAAHLLQNSFRLPHVEVSPLLRSGVSYSRAALRRHGPFPETLAFGEDLALNDRLIEAGVEIVAAREVVAAHHYPTSIAGLVADQFRRGRQRGSIHRGPLRRLQLLAGAILSPALGVVRASGRGSPIRGRELAAVAPLLAAASVVTAAGNVAGDTSAPESAPELTSLRRRMWLRRTLADRTAPARATARRRARAASPPRPAGETSAA
jgi:hypothetical protein